MSTSASSNLIATVESYLCPSIPVGTSNDPSLPALHLIPTSTLTKLRNVGPARVKDMRILGQSRQIISHIPINASPQTCTNFNDALYAGIRLNPERFAPLALLPCRNRDGMEAAKELQRCVTKYKFVGGMIGLRRGAGQAGDILDDSFDQLWVVAERYRVPIALRQTWPMGSEIAEYQLDFSDSVIAPLVTHIHTSHSNSPLSLLHLYLAGVFDRFPTLKLIICHPGALPSLLPRIENLLSQIDGADKPKRGYLDVWQHNIYLTTADVQEMSTMRALLEQIPMDRVLYGSNYPLEERGKELMEELRESGFLTKEEYERVAWGNAEALFGLKSVAGKAARK